MSCRARRPHLLPPAVLPLLLLVGASVGSAAPVQGDVMAPDGAEQSLQWTLASIPADLALATPAGAAQSPKPSRPDRPDTPRDTGGVPMGGVPDPGGYALMGLLLLAAGLGARAWSHRATRGQRGLSKNT